MKIKYGRFLAAKFALVMSMNAMATGIPVLDALNTVQSTISAIEDVSQTMQMADSYETQLEQLADQERNSQGPSSWRWDQADRTLDGVLKTVDALSPMFGGQQGIDEYLSGFKGLDGYSSDQITKCIQSAGCQSTHNQQVQDAQDIRSQQQVLANQAAMRNVMEQQKLIMQDAKQLRYLQEIAQDSEGRMAAMQAGNQLASAQVNNLLQLRTLLLAQQQMQAAQAQAQTESDAQIRARNRQMLRMPDEPRSATNGERF